MLGRVGPKAGDLGSFSAATFTPSASLWGSSRGIVAAVQCHGTPKVRIWAESTLS